MAGLDAIRLVRPDDALCAKYRTLGLWHETSLGAFIDDRLRTNAALEARIWSSAAPYRGTCGELRDAARRVAGGLWARGIRPGDVVSYQLPNSFAALAVLYGAAIAGAVLVPVVHFYGPKELRFILEQSGSKLHVTVTECRELVASPPLESLPSVSPDAPCLIAYTSGTTSDPKGVIHASRSVLAELYQLARRDARGSHPLLVGAPVAHAMGMLGGALLPLVLRRPIHLIDRWEPARVLEAMLEADLSAGSGSTYFLTSLLEHPGFTPAHAERIRYAGLGGAPVPRAVCDLAESLGIAVARSYGSTEHMTITMGHLDDAPDARKYTDGRLLDGCELRLLDDAGHPVPVGTPGEIWSRGPDLFWGYTDPSLTAKVFDADGWYFTEDVGVLDARGCLTITDRIKDIIIRGGENVSAAEVEEQLVRLPGVLEVAVVAAPDERLGERGCACFRMADGQAAPELSLLREHLAAAGLAKQKWPEEVLVVPDFPRTPTGKIKKAVLRQQLAAR